jgi:hypothetical protein
MVSEYKYADVDSQQPLIMEQAWQRLSPIRILAVTREDLHSMAATSLGACSRLPLFYSALV